MLTPPISLTVTFSSISPTILLTATMLQPVQYFDHFAQYFDDFDHFDADLGHGDSIVNEDKTDDN